MGLVDVGGKRTKVESRLTIVVASETGGKVAVSDPITAKVGYGSVESPSAGGAIVKV